MAPSFPCEHCGASLHYDPHASRLKCPYCGTENDIPVATGAVIQEHDYRSALDAARREQFETEHLVVRCPSCAAETTFGANVTATACAFCGSPLVRTTETRKWIKPEAVLPFRITQNDAEKVFREWLGTLWFAPNALKKQARHEHGLKGVYLPAWTYDSNTVTQYQGRRGEYYYEEHWVTVPDGRGGTRQERRQQQKIRWYPASGTVYNRFDDVLVMASTTLPREYTENLEPWDMPNLVPYQDDYLSGFQSESYQVKLEDGFGEARLQMKPVIESTIHRDIGGDVQDILSAETEYQNITFKHILLPIWMSGYRFQGKTYRFLVNGRSGEVQGERPWSGFKIAFLVIVVLIIVFLIFTLSQQSS